MRREQAKVGTYVRWANDTHPDRVWQIIDPIRWPGVRIVRFAYGRRPMHSHYEITVLTKNLTQVPPLLILAMAAEEEV